MNYRSREHYFIDHLFRYYIMCAAKTHRIRIFRSDEVRKIYVRSKDSLHRNVIVDWTTSLHALMNAA